MDLRSFRAESVEKALEQAREHYEREPMILSKRSINGDRYGLQNQIELITTERPAIDENTTGVGALLRAGRKRPTVLNGFEQLLAQQGVSSSLRSRLVSDYYDRSSADSDSINLELMAKILGQYVSFVSRDHFSLPLKAVVGPSGAGKTTYIAKLAARAVAAGQRRIGLISADSHRICGAAELETYAKILGIPFACIDSREELESALANFADRETILIDTPGLGPYDQALGNELLRLLGGIESLGLDLVIPATINRPDMIRLINSLAEFDIDSVLVSKIDQTCYFGLCINTLAEARIPVRLLGWGSEVPGSVGKASASQCLDLLIKGIASLESSDLQTRQ